MPWPGSIVDIVRNRLPEAEEGAGALLDGFPRTAAQARALDEMLAGEGHRVSFIVALEVPESVLVDRLLHRAEVEGRTDDNRESIAERMREYHKLTEAVLEHYRKQGVPIDPVGAREVPGPARRLALPDEALHLLGQAGLLRRHHVEVRVDLADEGLEGRLVLWPHTPGSDRRIGVADQVEHETQPKRQVQVVVQRRTIAGTDVGHLLLERIVVPLRRLCPSHPIRKVAQPPHLLGGRVQRLGAEADA